MLLNTLTLAERERLAYAEGFTTTAALLAQASDDAIDLEAAQDAALDAEMNREKLEKDQERRIAILDNDLGRMEDRLNNMAAFVQLAADYLKDGDVDRAGKRTPQFSHSRMHSKNLNPLEQNYVLLI